MSLVLLFFFLTGHEREEGATTVDGPFKGENRSCVFSISMFTLNSDTKVRVTPRGVRSTYVVSGPDTVVLRLLRLDPISLDILFVKFNHINMSVYFCTSLFVEISIPLFLLW